MDLEIDDGEKTRDVDPHFDTNNDDEKPQNDGDATRNTKWYKFRNNHLL